MVNTNTKIDYDKAFQIFTSKDEYDILNRPQFCSPFTQSGKYVATDACSIIYLPIEYAELNYQPSDVPKCDRYLNIESVMNVDISVSELEAKLIPELVDEIIEETTESECRDCDGKGTMECDLEHEHDCNECGGDGKIITIIKKPTGKKIPNQEKKYKLLGVGFMYKQLRRLIDACRLLEIETITKTFGTNGVGNLFKCGNAWILVMPCLTTDDEENEFTIIL